jgi:aminopeptidase S
MRSDRRIGGWRSAPVVLMVAVLAGCAPAAAPPQPPNTGADSPFARELVEKVSGDGAAPHLRALQRIADENGGNRASPGPGYDASVDYVAGVLRNAGFDVTTPEFVGEGPDEKPVRMRNVVAQTRTGSPDRVVLAGAHLDSVPEGPGINDNGSGVAALLEIATQMGGSPPVANMVRFGFWGHEEVDYAGSEQYVESLPRRSELLYLNVDMLGSPNAGYFVQGGVGRDEDETGPSGSAEVAQVLVQQLAAVGIEAETVPFDDGSDYAPFIEAGIPSAGVLTGDEQRKRAAEAQRWGGQAGTVFDRCYHSSCDRADNVDATALDRFTDAVAGTVAYFGGTWLVTA